MNGFEDLFPPAMVGGDAEGHELVEFDFVLRMGLQEFGLAEARRRRGRTTCGVTIRAGAMSLSLRLLARSTVHTRD